MKVKFNLLLLLLVSFSSYAQLNLTQIGHITYAPQSVAGVWHYVDSVGHEYALVGANDRVSIVDLAIPSNPVEIQSVPAIPGQESLWRELKVAGKYAYAGSEGGGGIIIIDLSNLPASINYKHYYGDGLILNQLQTSHTVAVTDGYLYAFGCSPLANGGVVILDLADPWNPTYVGMYDQQYVHDGYIRNDTLWAGEIYAGQFSVIDVTNKSNPVLITNQITPGQFCHNTWLSDNGKYLFTTDELNNVPLGSFDVSNLNNIKLLDTYFTDSMPTHEVHNTRVLNDFLINPSYGSQLTICDAARPDNIIEIANYPTGNYLNWDATPYLPSGHIISTDVDGGFYVFQANYIRACYFEGIVTDSTTGLPIQNASIVGLPTALSSNLIGEYKSGTSIAGNYNFTFSKPGYIAKTFNNVSLANGQLTQLNVALAPLIVSGSVLDLSGNPIPNATINFYDGVSSESVNTDMNGLFTINTLSSINYDVTAAVWGYKSSCMNVLTDGTAPINFVLTPGYYDDFTSDNGWTVLSSASTGNWQRAIPVGTIFQGNISNPNADVNGDCGGFAFVTGNNPGTSPNTDDVDNGFTRLHSPLMDLTTYTDPYVDYYRWFYIQNGLNPNSVDTLMIYLNDGVNTILIDEVSTTVSGTNSWVNKKIRIKDFMVPTSTMRIEVFIQDKVGSGNIVEAGFDHFQVTEGLSALSNNSAHQMLVSPNPFNNEINIKLTNFDNNEPLFYALVDMQGRLIKSNSIVSQNTSINGLNDLCNGMYLLQIYNDKSVILTEKIVK